MAPGHPQGKGRTPAASEPAPRRAPPPRQVLSFRGAAPRGPGPTCPPFMSFMFMAFFMPLPFSFLFFFFLQQHFLQMQKQQVMSRRPATTAMAISAHGGTARGSAGVSEPAPPRALRQAACHWCLALPRAAALGTHLPPDGRPPGLSQERQPTGR